MKLTIGWLYPDLMNTYGDRGNIIALTYRARKRNINVMIKRISLNNSPKEIDDCDLLFMGGAQDKQQEIVNNDLLKNKGKFLKEKIDDGAPGLYVCGAYQFLGKYYLTADSLKIIGLGIFDLYTKNPGLNYKRCIGDIIVKSDFLGGSFLVGFENHGGRTYLGKNILPFGKVLKGYGNNGEDKTEGAIYKNSIGTYLHGPILPKNPELTDWLIKKALEKKYQKKIVLKKIDNEIEKLAKNRFVGNLGG